MRQFDLNIEKVLEDWAVSYAIREIIANALDEQKLTDTPEIRIYQDNASDWHIRDYGRGLRYQHLTQNENQEKQTHPHLIGKFGVGLKDALATFDRHNIGVKIESRYGCITTQKSKKHGFSDILTLHAYIDAPDDPDMIGTDFCLHGCTQKDIDDAEAFFLCFKNLRKLESTSYGDIFEKRNGISEIFINGIKVAEEENFLFTYDITSVNSVLRKALNRERTNVGRAAYADRVRTILLNAKSEDVLGLLTENLSKMSSGTQADEMKWIDVQTYAIRHLHATEDTVFVTPEEMENSSGEVLDIIKNSGKKAVFVTDAVKSKIENDVDTSGNKITTVERVIEDYNDSFQYDFIPYEDLAPEEQRVFDLTPKILSLTNSDVSAEQVKISEHVHLDDSEETTEGVWDTEEEIVVIRRDVLQSAEHFCGVLVHELTHADTGYEDVTRSFETALTEQIGYFAWKYLSEGKKNSDESNSEKNSSMSNDAFCQKLYMMVTLHGDETAKCELGQMFLQGDSVQQDTEKAMNLFKQAANLGCSQAYKYIGDMYNEGTGVKESDAKAFEWYMKAAKAGNAEAQRIVGCYYYERLGTEKSLSKMLKWWTCAARQGNQRAQNNLVFAYLSEDIAGIDFDKALKWATLAAQSGEYIGLSLLGAKYFIQKQWEKGIYYLVKAEKHGCEYGKMFLHEIEGWELAWLESLINKYRTNLPDDFEATETYEQQSFEDLLK